MPRQVVLDHYEVREDGTIFVQLDKQVVDEGEVLAREPHRFPVLPGVNLDAQVDAVNNGLATLGYPRVSQTAVERIRRIVRLEHTPLVKRTFKARMEAEAKAIREAEGAAKPKPANK